MKCLSSHLLYLHPCVSLSQVTLMHRPPLTSSSKPAALGFTTVPHCSSRTASPPKVLMQISSFSMMWTSETSWVKFRYGAFFFISHLFNTQLCMFVTIYNCFIGVSKGCLLVFLPSLRCMMDTLCIILHQEGFLWSLKMLYLSLMSVAQ